MNEKRKRLIPRLLDVFVVRFLIVFCDFKYFIDKANKFVIFINLLFVKRNHSQNIFFKVFLFFFIFLPFCCEAGEIFPSQSVLNFEHCGFLRCEESLQVVDRFGAMRQFTYFKYFDKGQESFFECIESFSLFMFSCDNESQKSGNQDGKSDEANFYNYLRTTITIPFRYFLLHQH